MSPACTSRIPECCGAYRKNPLEHQEHEDEDIHRDTCSYANAAKTKTYCVHEGPSEAAIREAATANTLPIDSITEVPGRLLPK